MSARDAESGSSTYKGGSGRAGGLGNGGIGGGMGGGGMGGGAGRNGGIGSNTGMQTGGTWHGNTAYGRAGGNVQAYGMRDAASLAKAGMGPTAGTYGNFKTPSGQAMFGGSPVQGQSFTGMNMGQALSQAQRAQAAWQAAQGVPGLLGGVAQPAGVAGPQYPAYEAEMALPEYPPAPPATLPFNKYGALYAYRSPYGPEALAQIGKYGQENWNKSSDAYHSWAGYGPNYGRNNSVKGDLDTSNKPDGGYY